MWTWTPSLTGFWRWEVAGQENRSNYSRQRFVISAKRHAKFLYRSLYCWNWKPQSRQAQKFFLIAKCGFKFEADWVFIADMRRHPWTVLWPASAFWIWGLSARGQLPISRWLRRSRKAVSGNDLFTSSLQDQIPRKFLHPTRKPRMCIHQSDLRILWRMQKKVQY